MRRTIYLFLTLTLLISASAFASGSSTPTAGGFPDAEPNPHLVTETLNCVVVGIQEDGKIIIRDADSDKTRWLSYSEKTKFLAQNKKAFNGKKKLQAADLKVGHEIKVTLRPATGEVTKVRVLKKS